MPIMAAHLLGMRFADSDSVFEQPVYWMGLLWEFRAGIAAAEKAHSK